MREIVIAESIDTRTPKPNVSAKPFIKGVPSQNKIIEVIMLEVLESLTEGQALEKPV